MDQERYLKEKYYSLFEAKLENPSKKRKKTRSVTNLVEYKELIDMKNQLKLQKSIIY